MNETGHFEGKNVSSIEDSVLVTFVNKLKLLNLNN